MLSLIENTNSLLYGQLQTVKQNYVSSNENGGFMHRTLNTGSPTLDSYFDTIHTHKKPLCWYTANGEGVCVSQGLWKLYR